MNVASELLPIERACCNYVGIAEQAECALVALAAVGVTGPAATRIAASAAADVAERYNAARRANYTIDYMPEDTARRLRERSSVIGNLRALAAEPSKVAA